MTQASRPQTGTSATFLDSGPYTADEWAEIFNSFFVGPNAADQGPLATYQNELEVTTVAGGAPDPEVLIDTGAGIVNGRALFNSAQIDFDLNANKPLGNPRIDVVCMVENNSNAPITQSAALNNLIFPTDTTDYNGLSSIPAYTARLAILAGTEAGAPVAPVLDTNPTGTYMVPLAQYQISNAAPAVITNFTDLRDWASSPLATKQRIEEQVLATATAQVTFSSIPQYYRHLEIQFSGGNDAAVGTTDYVQCFFNGVWVGGLYHWNLTSVTYIPPGPATTAVGGGTAINNPQSFWMVSDTNGTSQASLIIPNYTSSTIEKVAHAQYSYARLDGSPVNVSGRAATFYDATGAITQIDLSISGGAPNFGVGSIFTLYGIL